MRSDLKLKCGDAELDIVTAYDQVADLGVSACQADLRAIAARSIRRALHAEAECERLRDTMRRAANAIRLGLTVTGIKSKGLETIADALLREGDANG